MATESVELVGGPQDGANVRGQFHGQSQVFVGPRWLGDGYAAWGREQSDRFPACYHRCHDGRFHFVGYTPF